MRFPLKPESPVRCTTFPGNIFIQLHMLLCYNEKKKVKLFPEFYERQFIMINYIWPIAMIIFANIFYQICAKSVPSDMNPFASLTITYAVGTVISLVFYFILNKNADLIAEYGKLNWAPFVLGLVIVFLEVGYIYAYKAGWPVSTAQIVQAAVVAVALIFIGLFFYHEIITWKKLMGIAMCLGGLFFINMK